MNFSERLTLMRAALGKKPTPEAVNILSRVFPGQMTEPPEKGAVGILEGYSHMPWLRACAGKVAASLGAVEWRLYVTRRGKGPQRKAYRDRRLQRAGYEQRKGLLNEHANMDELDEITDHPFLDLLTKGNGYHTGVALRRIEAIHLDLVGEAFMLKGRNGLGAPTALWPIPPTWIQNTPVPQHPFFRVSYRGWNEEIPATEVLWLCDPNPAQPYGRGVGLGQAISDEAEIDEYAARTTRQLFFNRAQPDFLVFPKGERADMNPTETKRFEQTWLDRLQGYWRSWKPMFLSREVGVYEFKKDVEALQLVPIRQQERDIILQIWGIPPEKMGVVSSSNRATIEGADLIYAKDVLVPRLEFRRSFFQEMLIPEYDDRLIVDYVTPVMEDKEFALKVAAAAPWAMDGNEWRAIMGLGDKPEFEGVYFVPALTTPVSADQLAVDLGPSEPDTGKDEEIPAPDGYPAKPVVTSDVGEQAVTAPTISLNGAQVAAMIEIIIAVAQGQIPRETGVLTIMTAFAISRELADQLMGEVGAGFVPSTQQAESDASATSTSTEGPPQPKKSLLDRMTDAILETVTRQPVIQNTVNVPERSVTVEGAKIDVNLPETKVDVAAPIIHVAPAQVQVAAPQVDVHVPEPKPRKERRTVTRDPASHLVTKIDIEET